jgi:16S rRNA (guanine527-N7)-methyltransferase
MADDPGTGAGIADLRARIDPFLNGAFEKSFQQGFLGRMPIQDQIDHALGFVALLEGHLGGAPVSVIDLGSGGGVPGLVLISCWPETRVVLMDANVRRTEFLVDTITAWARGGDAEVVRGRAEELGRIPEMRETFAVVTSRSFGIPAATAECGSSFLEVEGLMAISEPPGGAELDRWPVGGLDKLSLAPLGSERPDHRFGYQLLAKTRPIDDRYPRRVGIPVKRPAF